ncbi:MAG: M56 family metallopeptidase [Draconibacterium sp.]|nr:M56 family metallopeptidase [Draconibacterium sp.]
METLFQILLKASAGIALFYMLYWLLLSKETFYNANRWFLILALICSVAMPLFPIQYIVLVEPEKNTTFVEVLSNTINNIQHNNYEILEDKSFNWTFGIFLAYITGAAIFLIRLLTQTSILIYLMVKNKVKLINGIRIVENEKYGLPFSFFNVVFINPKFHKQTELPEILAHEKVHIRENHWFDLLFIELLTVIFWFNPFIWFFERAIKQNHEYLADKGVILQGHSVGRYQAILLNQLMGMQIIGVTNNLNFALNTNRLKMMTKKKTSRVLGVKFVWALPAIAVLLFAFAEPDYRTNDSLAKRTNAAIQEIEWKNPVKVEGIVLDENGKPKPGTSVVILETTIGTVCDINGEFYLEIPENATIVISFVGKKTIKDTYAEIISGNKKKDVFHREYRMEEEVIEINTNLSELELLPPPMPITREISDAPPPPSEVDSEEVVFFVVEDMPEYEGGHSRLVKYINRMQTKLAELENLKGKAKVSFTVNQEGKVTDIIVVEKDNDDVAKGAYKIVDGMEDWKPGSQRGKKVPVKFQIPVEFK